MLSEPIFDIRPTYSAPASVAFTANLPIVYMRRIQRLRLTPVFDAQTIIGRYGRPITLELKGLPAIGAIPEVSIHLDRLAAAFG